MGHAGRCGWLDHVFQSGGQTTAHCANRDQIVRLARLADATPDGWDMIADVLHEALFGEGVAG
jgi:hypothetical protein